MKINNKIKEKVDWEEYFKDGGVYDMTEKKLLDSVEHDEELYNENK